MLNFVDSCVVDDELLFTGWEYSASQKSFVSAKLQHSVAFYVFAGNNMEKIAMEDVNRFKAQTFKDFDDFIAKAFTIYKIEFSQNVQDWKRAQCTCASYCLDYMCKHVVGIAFRLGILQVPDVLLARMEEPITARTPRGRPRRARPALIKD